MYNTNPNLTLLNGVAQGTGENGRIGRLTKNLWLDMDLLIYTYASYAGMIPVRAYIVAETTALGSALAPAQFFVDTTNFQSTSQRDRSNRNASRYVVLWDSGIHILGTTSAASGQTAPWGLGQLPLAKAFSLHLPLNFHTDYSRGNAGTIADIETNSIYLMVVTDLSQQNTLSCSGGWTLCFNDDS